MPFDFSTDIHVGNILIDFPSSLDARSIPQLEREYGEPFTGPIERCDGKPLSPGGFSTHDTEAICSGKQAKEFTLADAPLVLSEFGEDICITAPARIIQQEHTIYAEASREVQFC